MSILWILDSNSRYPYIPLVIGRAGKQVSSYQASYNHRATAFVTQTDSDVWAVFSFLYLCPIFDLGLHGNRSRVPRMVNFAGLGALMRRKDANRNLLGRVGFNLIGTG
jgi:hypothetical protein